VRRLTILLAALGALLLVPAAQAFANGTLHVNVEGTGAGEVSSVGGAAAMEPQSQEAKETFESFGNEWEGSPPITCSGPPASGTCATELAGEIESIALRAIPAPHSEFVGWVLGPETSPPAGCEPGGNFTEPGENPTFCLAEGAFGSNAEVTAIFNAKSGSTNRVPLTITKSAGGPGATGTVSSKPKGINCGSACDSAKASMYEGSAVILTAKPSSGDTFTKWEGGDCEGIVATTCTVTMNQAEEVKAVFAGSTKPIVDPQALSVSKGGSTGYGTVKAAGLACEAECSETVVLYQGPVFSPKFKAGKTVELKETPAFGSEFSGWSGACSGSETSCKVTMEEALSVTAEFSAKPNATLTIAKNSYESGDGTVSSKPKAINCAMTCKTQSASVPENEAIVLKEKPATGMSFSGWSGGGCSGTAETCTVSISAATTVTATFSGAPKAIVNPQELTVAKAGSGFGTVKAAGLACEALCSSTVGLYQGPIALPKPKPGKAVLLKASSAPGSKQVVWSGCESEPSATECVVTMEEAKPVTATFDELE
jgi:hypothetical protein